MNFLVFILNSILVTIYFEAYILPTNIGNKSPVLGLVSYITKYRVDSNSGRCLLKVGDFLLQQSIDCL